MRLEGLTHLVALKYCQLNTGNRFEILPNEHDSFLSESPANPATERKIWLNLFGTRKFALVLQPKRIFLCSK